MVLVAARVRYLWIQLMRWIWKKDDLQTDSGDMEPKGEGIDNAKVAGRWGRINVRNTNLNRG